MSDSNYHLLGEERTQRLLERNSEEEHIAPLETGRSNTRIPDLDAFLVRVYSYYHGKGFLCIFLNSVFNLLSLLWALFLTTLLASLVDYECLFTLYDLSMCIQYQGMHPLMIVCLVMFSAFWIWEFFKFLRETLGNIEIKHFFEKELNISGTDLHTIEWREVVQKIVKVPGLCALKPNEPLTALDIANRIMRRDNYMIAMINKNVFNLEVPLPFFPQRPLVTKTVEWSLSYAVFDFAFRSHNNNVGGLSDLFLDRANSGSLAQLLRKRFRMLGIISLFLSPFVFVFLVIYAFFSYTEELRRQPNRFAMRQWSRLARWSFRELNELPHVFQYRLNASYEPAEKYVNSFPSHLFSILAGFVSFIISSVLAVLIVVSVIDDESLLKLSLFEGRSAYWFLGIGGVIVAGCRSMIPDEHVALDPKKAMEDVVQHTHYLPKTWRGRVHTHHVFVEFASMFQLKAINVTMELLSVLLTPLILLISLPQSADSIVEFFLNNTVKQEGVGYVCKFAVFPMDDFMLTESRRARMKQGKVEKSFLNFKANHPEWKAPPPAERYLENISEALTVSAIPGTANVSRSVHVNLVGASQIRKPENNNEPPEYLEKPTEEVFDPQSLQESIASLHKIHRLFYRNNTQGTADPKIL